MTDLELLALCAFEEANLEPDDGLAAVVRVVLNRVRSRFQCDGAIADAIFHGDGEAFSWAAFEMVQGRYRRVASGLPAIDARAARLARAAQRFPRAWSRALAIAGRVVAGTYQGVDYDRLTDAVVLYLDPALASAAWAIPEKFVCRIGRHDFFRA